MAKQFMVRQTVFEYLKNNAGRKFTAQQIAEWMFETYPDECKEKGRRNNWNLDKAALVQHLVTVIGRNRRHIIRKNYPRIKITADSPSKYYYSTQSDEDEVAQAEAGQDAASAAPDSVSPASSQRLYERDLYPMLMQYLQGDDVFSMRIEENTSSNRRGENGNQWLHPDIVGMEDLGADWDREVRDCVHEYFDKRTRLWSFEVKLLLNGSNVRKCYFQAVSNSSWANFAYLVAKDIEGTDTMKELRLLSAAHGIGLIKLNVEDPSESEVLIPARERAVVDWDMVNRLAQENRDFKEFVKRIRRFYQTGETSAADWGLPEVDD